MCVSIPGSGGFTPVSGPMSIPVSGPFAVGGGDTPVPVGGGYPVRGRVIPPRLGEGVPMSWSTCYAAGGLSLAFTQNVQHNELFLNSFLNITTHLSKITDSFK